MHYHDKESQVLVAAVRGELTESIHRGHIAVVNIHRHTVAYAGNPDHYTFARSTAKLLQAIPLLEAGGAEAYGFNDKQVALLCSSHNGEDAHAATADAILERLGLHESALLCGVHEPYHQPTAERLKAQGIPLTPLRNNCSGKHSGMLALALLRHWSTGQYSDLEHPVQQQMLHIMSDMTGIPAGQITLGTDGCGVPVFAVPISSLAYAYARLGQPIDLPDARAQACKRIIKSAANEPYYVAGSGRFDTRLIEVTQGRLIGKMGAEGVFALTVPEQGLGIAVKIEDGSMRALYPAVMEALIQLDLLQKHEIEALSEFQQPPIVNCQKAVVGRLQPVLKLEVHSKSI
ncbi:asparaginase [Paenibacillus rigui]|uniref:Asparaginase n=2 Tax=Paenibacillus rigui TaxID=554312 RepID=A0A229UR30_9BACL|nr:asparaginase [Paenibacillus rigui]